MTFKIRLVIMGLVLATAGWFLLGVLLLGRSGIEEFLQSTALKWSFRILIIVVPIVLVIKRGWLTRALRDGRFRLGLSIFYGIGFIGWLWGITDLIG